MDVSQHFPEREVPIIFGALHTRVAVQGKGHVEVPVLCAWEHDGDSSRIIYLSDPYWQQQDGSLNFPMSLSIEGDVVTVIVNHGDRSNRIVKFAVKAVVQEIQESIEKDDVSRNLNNFTEQRVQQINQEHKSSVKQ